MIKTEMLMPFRMFIKAAKKKLAFERKFVPAERYEMYKGIIDDTLKCPDELSVLSFLEDLDIDERCKKCNEVDAYFNRCNIEIFVEELQIMLQSATLKEYFHMDDVYTNYVYVEIISAEEDKYKVKVLGKQPENRVGLSRTLSVEVGELLDLPVRHNVLTVPYPPEILVEKLSLALYGEWCLIAFRI